MGPLGAHCKAILRGPECPNMREKGISKEEMKKRENECWEIGMKYCLSDQECGGVALQPDERKQNKNKRFMICGRRFTTRETKLFKTENPDTLKGGLMRFQCTERDRKYIGVKFPECPKGRFTYIGPGVCRRELGNIALWEGDKTKPK